MSFRDTVASDIRSVFLNTEEFAERRTIRWDGNTYEDVPVVLSGLKEKDRRTLVNDHAQGLYLVHAVLHCDLRDIGGIQPEKGTRLMIADREGGSFFRRFYVASSVVEMGMLRAELEAIDE